MIHQDPDVVPTWPKNRRQMLCLVIEISGTTRQARQGNARTIPAQERRRRRVQLMRPNLPVNSDGDAIRAVRDSPAVAWSASPDPPSLVVTQRSSAHAVHVS